MKIGLDLGPLHSNKTGIGFYVYNIVSGLGKSDFEIRAQVISFLKLGNIKNELSDLDIDIKIDRAILPYRVYKRISKIIPYNNLFKEKVDIHHFFSFTVPYKIKGKVIVTVYDMVYKKFPETMEKENLEYLEKNVERSVKRANIVITISENAKREIIEYTNIDSNKIKVVYPGVDIAPYVTGTDYSKYSQIKNKYNLPDKYLLYLGTLEPRKNISLLIEAFSMYKKSNTDDIKLVIAGKKGWMYDDIFNKVKELNINKEVVFTNYVDESDKPEIYKNSKAFIFPSLYEGFGIPVLEAMASGVPVITSSSSSLPEVAGNAAVLIDPKNVNSIYKAIKNVLNDSKLRREMIIKGKEQCTKFTWQKSVEKLCEIYKELV
ncbi:glycosyltransferase family 4 protein [Clostridium sp. DL1XJH146]